jgi:DNA-binding XRE family transcriptional regulator
MDSKNNVRKFREGKMLSKAALAQLAGISPLTVARIERSMPCRIGTRRRILLALGLKLSEKRRVFEDS